MELRHIRYFLVLAEELNFSRAAERLYIAQPPLSRQIQELEKEVGAKLFHRTNRQVILTNAGKVFLKHAHQIHDQVEHACISARLSSTGREGEFRIGFNGAINDLIPTLKKYRELHPEVGIILKQMNASEQIEALNEKSIDVANISIPVNNEKIKVIPLRTMRFMIAMPEKHPLATKKSIYMNDLSDETFIATPKSAGVLYYETFMSIFKEAKFTPKVTIQAHDLHTVLTLVSSGMGVTLTPSPSSPVHGIIKREVEDIDLSIEASLAWRIDNGSEILDEFLKFFEEFDHNEVLTVDK